MREPKKQAVISISKLVMVIQERQKEISEGVLKSPAADFARYRHLVGRHEGLQEAIDLIREAAKDEDE